MPKYSRISCQLHIMPLMLLMSCRSCRNSCRSCQNSCLLMPKFMFAHAKAHVCSCHANSCDFSCQLMSCPSCHKFRSCQLMSCPSHAKFLSPSCHSCHERICSCATHAIAVVKFSAHAQLMPRILIAHATHAISSRSNMIMTCCWNLLFLVLRYRYCAIVLRTKKFYTWSLESEAFEIRSHFGTHFRRHFWERSNGDLPIKKSTRKKSYESEANWQPLSRNTDIFSRNTKNLVG